MPRFRSKPREIDAEQFSEGDIIPAGVCFGWKCGGPVKDTAHVHTMHGGQRVDLAFGDWIVPEPDGVHFYPIKDEVLRDKYEPI